MSALISMRSRIAFIVLLIIIIVSFFAYVSGALRAGAYWGLQEAAKQGNNRLSYFLLYLGTPFSPDDNIADWYYSSQLKDTPLHYAAIQGNVRLGSELIQQGAKIDWCCCSCITHLHEAIRNGNYKVAQLLLESVSDPSIPYNTTCSPIVLARKKMNTS